MKIVRMLLLPLVLAGLMNATEQAEQFTTSMEEFASELEKRQESNLKFWGYVTEQFSRDCHLGADVLRIIYPNRDVLPVTPSEMVQMLQEKHADNKSCLDIVKEKQERSDLCKRLAQGYENIIEISNILIASGRGDVLLTSMKESEIENAAELVQKRKAEKLEDSEQ